MNWSRKNISSLSESLLEHIVFLKSLRNKSDNPSSQLELSFEVRMKLFVMIIKNILQSSQANQQKVMYEEMWGSFLC
jgi:hypothetical protein